MVDWTTIVGVVRVDESEAACRTAVAPRSRPIQQVPNRTRVPPCTPV